MAIYSLIGRGMPFPKEKKMKNNQVFALILKSIGVATTFHKCGDVYKTHNTPIQYIFDTTQQRITCIKPITVFNGYEYVKEYVNEQYALTHSDGRICLSRV